MAKLIVIRGNSGSGKSTLASLVQQITPNCAVIAQDYYIKYTPATKTEAQEIQRKERIFNDIKSALGRYDVVIAEGVFDSRRYADNFTDLINYHQTDNYFYYLDIPFAETLRRHQNREKRDQFGEVEMAGWYADGDHLNYPFEVVFDEDDDVEKILEKICVSSGIKDMVR